AQARAMMAGADGLADVKTDAHVHGLRGTGVVVGVKGPLDGYGAFDALPGRVEGDHEAVADGLDFLAGVFVELLPHDLLVGGHDGVGGLVAVMLAQAGRPDDVGEQNRHRARFSHGDILSRVHARAWSVHRKSLALSGSSVRWSRFTAPHPERRRRDTGQDGP